jgi:hypothetical protein
MNGFIDWLLGLTVTEKTTTIDGTEVIHVGSSGLSQRATLRNAISYAMQGLAVTWNAGATVFTGLKLTVTDTASSASSKLVDLIVGSTSMFSIDKTGKTTSAGGAVFGGATNNLTISNSGVVSLNGTAKILHHAQLPFTAMVVGTAAAAYNSGVVAGPLMNVNTDILYTTVELYSSWDGANVVFEIDWTPMTNITDGQTVLFNWSWKAIAEGEDADTGTAATFTATYTSVGTTSAGTMIHTPCVMAYNNANQPLTVGDHIYVKLLRDASGDSFNGDIIATAFEFIYYANGLSGA